MMGDKGFTYGDTFEVPDIPGVVWKIHDARDIAQVGRAGGTFAVCEPVVEYGTPVRIGRAERKHVRVQIASGWAGSTAVRVSAGSNVFAGGALTEAQVALIKSAFGGLTFDLPPLSVADIRAEYIRRVVNAAESAAYDVSRKTPDREAQRESRDIIRSAVDAATVDEAVRLAGEAFSAELLDSLRRTGSGGGVSA